MQLPERRPSARAGFTLLEMVFAFAILAGLLTTLASITMKEAQDQEDRAIAEHLLKASRGLWYYVRENEAALAAEAAIGPIEIPISVLTTNSRYLPSTFLAVNRLGQTLRFVVQRNADNLPAGFVTTTGGRDFTQLRAAAISAVLAGAAGAVPPNAGPIIGTTGAWRIQPRVLTGAGVLAAPNRVVVSAIYSRPENSLNFVSRMPISGQPEATRLRTPLDLGGNNIMNVDQLAGNNLRATDISAGANATAGQNVVADSISAMGNITGANISAGASMLAGTDLAAGRDIRATDPATGLLSGQTLSVTSASAHDISATSASAPVAIIGTDANVVNSATTTTLQSLDFTAATVTTPSAAAGDVTSTIGSAGQAAIPGGIGLSGSLFNTGSISAAGALITNGVIQSITTASRCIGCSPHAPPTQ